MASITVREFKRFIREIPEQFDEAELDYCDFSHCDSLQFTAEKFPNKEYPRAPARATFTISEWGEKDHVYKIAGQKNPVKTIPIIEQSPTGCTCPECVPEQWKRKTT